MIYSYNLFLYLFANNIVKYGNKYIKHLQLTRLALVWTPYSSYLAVNAQYSLSLAKLIFTNQSLK